MPRTVTIELSDEQDRDLSVAILDTINSWKQKAQYATDIGLTADADNILRGAFNLLRIGAALGYADLKVEDIDAQMKKMAEIRRFIHANS